MSTNLLVQHSHLFQMEMLGGHQTHLEIDLLIMQCFLLEVAVLAEQHKVRLVDLEELG
jgi:hypothetical protein